MFKKLIIFVFKAIGSYYISHTFFKVLHKNSIFPENWSAEFLNKYIVINSDVVLGYLIFIMSIMLLFIEHWIHKVKWHGLIELLSISKLIKIPNLSQISFDYTSDFLDITSTKEMIGTSEDIVIWGEVDYRIPSFYLKGRNNGRRPIGKVKGYIVSTKTNLNFPILLDGMKPEETHGIPGKCDFYVAAIFPDSKPPKQGYTVEDFWRHFGEFDFIFEYDGKKITKRFTERIVTTYLERKMQESPDNLTPKNKPRVKKKEIYPSEKEKIVGELKLFLIFNPIKGIIKKAANISSITDSGDNDFTFNFSLALPNPSYRILLSGDRNFEFEIINKTTGSARLRIKDVKDEIIRVDFIQD